MKMTKNPLVNRRSSPKFPKQLASVFAALAFCGASLHAGTWTNPDGGAFHDPANWNPAAVPGSGAFVVFNLDSDEPYEVTLSDNATTARNQVRTDRVNLDLGGFTLEGTDTARGIAVGVFAGDTGHLRIVNGFLSTTSFRIGEAADSTGTLIIGEGAKWTNSAASDNAATIGSSGTGTLIVENGGTAVFERLMMGRNDNMPGSESTLIVRGEGSKVTANALFTGGQFSEKTLIQIEDGGELETMAAFELARRGHEATMILDNASMLAHEAIRVGPFGPGAFPGAAELIVRNGASLVLTHAERDIRLSEQPGNQSTLQASSGAQVVLPRFLILDGQGNGEANLHLDGEGTVVDIGSHLYVAWRDDARSNVSVSDGARLKIGHLARIGMGERSQSTVTVSNAFLDAVQGVRVGKANGAHAQLILDGATATTGRIDVVGRGTNATGEILLRGGSTWASLADGSTHFGVNGEGASGSLRIEEGSVLSVTGEEAAFQIGASEGAAGSVIVSGAGSRLEGDVFDLFVGGTRVIEDEDGNSSGGVGGQGYLEAADGGRIETAGAVTVWETGKLRIGPNGLSAAALVFSAEPGASLEAVLGAGKSAPAVISGDVVLENDARLTVELAPGFSAKEGESVPLLSYGGALTGTFQNLADGAIVEANGFQFAIEYGAGEIALRALEDVSVAGPGFEAWISQFDLPAGADAFDANPSGDGIPNAVKYALGLDPRLAEVEKRPATTLTEIDGQAYLSLRIEKDPSARARVEPEVSSDLQNWTRGPEHTTLLEETKTILHVRDNVPVATGQKRFLRLRIELE